MGYDGSSSRNTPISFGMKTPDFDSDDETDSFNHDSFNGSMVSITWSYFCLFSINLNQFWFGINALKFCNRIFLSFNFLSLDYKHFKKMLQSLNVFGITDIMYSINLMDFEVFLLDSYFLGWYISEYGWWWWRKHFIF